MTTRNLVVATVVSLAIALAVAAVAAGNDANPTFAFLTTLIVELVLLGVIDTAAQVSSQVHPRHMVEEKSTASDPALPLFERVDLEQLIAESFVGMAALTRACPFCTSWARPHRGGSERNFDSVDGTFDEETILEYRCALGHEFSAHTILSGELNRSADAA